MKLWEDDESGRFTTYALRGNLIDAIDDSKKRRKITYGSKEKNSFNVPNNLCLVSYSCDSSTIIGIEDQNNSTARFHIVVIIVNLPSLIIADKLQLHGNQSISAHDLGTKYRRSQSKTKLQKR